MRTEGVSGVYEIMNTVNDKRYIGSSMNVGRRIRQHRHRLRKGSHNNRHLQSSFLKYGEDAFDFNLLVACAIEDLAFHEQRTIQVSDSIKNGYNHRLHVETNRGIKLSDEARANMSRGQKGKPGSYGMLGKTQSDEARRKNSEAHQGMKRSAGTGDKISKALKGLKRSDEFREKVSAANKRRFQNQEEREKISRSLKGRKKGPFSKETRSRMSEAAKTSPNHHKIGGWNKGKRMSPEFCHQRSKARKGKPWSAARRAAHDRKKENNHVG